MLGGMSWRKIIMSEKKIDKRIFKKSPEELQEYFIFKKRGFILKNKKGKGSYKRKDKYVNKEE